MLVLYIKINKYINKVREKKSQAEQTKIYTCP